jgi:hypothetical protein
MIDDKTIAFYGGGSGDPSVGGFTWSGHFTWESLPEQVKHNQNNIRQGSGSGLT